MRGVARWVPPQKHLKTWKTKRNNNNKGEAIKTLDTLTPVEQAQENEEYEAYHTPRIKRLSLTSICIYSRPSFVSVFVICICIYSCVWLFVYVYLALRLPPHWLSSNQSRLIKIRPRSGSASPSLFLSISLFVCLRSYFYLRGELECCQIVILLLRCVFIHSIRIHMRLLSSPLYPECLCPFPTPGLTPFPLGNFCACVNSVDCVAPSSATRRRRRRRRQFGCVCFLFCHAPFTRVCFEQMFYLNAHYYYSISTSRIWERPVPVHTTQSGRNGFRAWRLPVNEFRWGWISKESLEIDLHNMLLL